MSFINKIATSGLVLCMTLSAAGNVCAAENAKNGESSDANGILFRIENIEPQKNADNLVDKCKFIVTAYNRTDVGLKTATLNFKWADTISKRFTIEDDSVKAVDDKKALTVVTKEVTLETLGAHKQRSYEAVVETDKCFLLFDSLEFTVADCKMENEEKGSKDKDAKGCKDKFNYITSKNPEYYSEFKDVPDSVIEKQVEEEKQKEVQKINQAVEDSKKELQEISDVLNKIK